MNKHETKTAEVNEQILDEEQLEQVSGGQKPLSDVKNTDLPESASNKMLIVCAPEHIA